MTIFFTSDHHFGHANIIKYCNRPFDSVEQMNEHMREKWCEVVKPDDVIYHLGDLALGDFESSMKVAASLPGKKYLIPGNHDRVSLVAPEKYRSRFWSVYEKAGFEILDEQMYFDLGAAVGEDSLQVVLCHYPPFGDSQTDEERFQHLRPVTDLPVIHGHTHQFDVGDGHFVHVGVDARGFAPVSARILYDEVQAAH